MRKCFRKIAAILSTIKPPKDCLLGKRILIIEDNKCDQEFMSRTIIKAGGRAVIACDGERGVISAVETKPDLIVLDYFLPEDTGLEICKRLKDDPSTRQIPILLVTINKSSNDMLECLSAGVHGYLQKPIGATSLISEIKFTLDNPGL